LLELNITQQIRFPRLGGFGERHSECLGLLHSLRCLVGRYPLPSVDTGRLYAHITEMRYINWTQSPHICRHHYSNFIDLSTTAFPTAAYLCQYSMEGERHPHLPAAFLLKRAFLAVTSSHHSLASCIVCLFSHTGQFSSFDVICLLISEDPTIIVVTLAWHIWMAAPHSPAIILCTTPVSSGVRVSLAGLSCSRVPRYRWHPNPGL
jgi:hypothetical protein